MKPRIRSLLKIIKCGGGEWEYGWNMIDNWYFDNIDNCWPWVMGKWRFIVFFSTFGICLRISTRKFHTFVSLKSRVFHSWFIIRSRMNSSSLDLTLLFPVLLLKGILCQGVREVMAGVFAVRLHWASSDGIGPFIMRADMQVMPWGKGHMHRLCSQIGFDPCLCHLPAVYPWQAT